MEDVEKQLKELQQNLFAITDKVVEIERIINNIRLTIKGEKDA